MFADRLTEAGIPTPNGRKGRRASTVYSLIGEWDKLYRYSRYRFWNRRYRQDPTRVSKRDTSEWVVIPEAHPPIISEEEREVLWEMAERASRKKRAAKPKFRFGV